MEQQTKPVFCKCVSKLTGNKMYVKSIKRSFKKSDTVELTPVERHARPLVIPDKETEAQIRHLIHQNYEGRYTVTFPTVEEVKERVKKDALQRMADFNNKAPKYWEKVLS